MAGHWRWVAVAALLIASTAALTAAQMSWSSTLLYWELDPRSGVGSLGAQTALTFTPDSRSLVTASEDQRLRTWNTGSAQLSRTVALNPATLRAGSPYVGTPAALSPDARWVVTLYPNRNADGLKLWDAATGALRWSGAWGGGGVAFSPDSKTLAAVTLPAKSGESRSTVTLWDVSTGKPRVPALSVAALVRGLAFSRDGRTLVTAGETAGRREGQVYLPGKGDVRIWDAATGKQVRPLSLLRTSASTVALSPDGRTLAVGSPHDTVTLWNVANARQVRALQAKEVARHGRELVGKALVHGLAFSPDGKLLIGAGGRSVHVWNGANGDYHHSLLLSAPRRTSGTPEAEGIAFSPDGRQVAVNAQRHRAVTVWHLR